MSTEKKYNFIIYGFGLFFVVSGFLIAFFWPLIFNWIWKEKLELNPSSETFKLWVKTPIPMYMDFYLFNWTNSEEFLKNPTVKPVFEEIGPFVFKEVHERVNIIWNNNNSVTYNQIRTWHFLPEESVDLSTEITNLNVIATAIARKASYYNEILKILVEFLNFVYKEKLIIKKPAREWLFDGISDSLLDFLRKVSPVPLPFKKFGWFYGRNLSSTYDGRFTIHTGEDNIFNLGMMEAWNYHNKTKYFSGECGVVKGSSGELFSPLTDMQNNLSIFISDICGFMQLNFSGKSTIEGIEGYHYIGNKNTFDNGTEYSNNSCFCSGECSPKGVRNLTSCRNAPLFISFPHFYLADPIYYTSIGGLKPDKNKHEFSLTIDPLTGIPLDVHAQLQLNILLQPLQLFHMFERVPKVYVPMVWFRQRVKVTSTLASRVIVLRILGKIGLGVSCGLAFIGLLIILIRLCKVQFWSNKKIRESLVFNSEEKEKEEEALTSDN